MLGLHPKIYDLLLRRFLIATIQCLQMEFQLLMLFMLYVTEPISCLMFLEVIFESLLSIRIWCSLFVQILIAACYGFVLFLMHQQLPVFHNMWQPLKLCLLTTQISLSYYSNWLYGSYNTQAAINRDMRQYLLISGLFCGIYQFVVEFCCLNSVVWKIPIVELGQLTSLTRIVKWPNIWLGFQQSLLPILVISAYYAPDLQLFGLAYCISTLITVQVIEINVIYRDSMFRKLPMTLRNELCWKDGELEVSLILALEATSLLGLEQQVAKNFYEDMSNTHCDECRLLFKLRNKYKWQKVRNIILDRIISYMKRLKHCQTMEKQLPLVEIHTKASHSNMRPLMLKKPEPQIFYSRRLCGQKPPFCLASKMSNKGINWFSSQKQLAYNYLQDMFERESKKKLMKYEISRGISLIHLIPGLACICERSLNEDTYGILQADLCRIIQVLLKLEHLLHTLKHIEKYSDDCLLQLLPATSRSLYKLVYNFEPYFEYLIADEKLLKHLQSRL